MSSRTAIKIGTRKSKLAMWQANYIADLLDAGGFQPVLIPIETKGDKILNVSVSKIGSKGVFTEELEKMLHTGEIDIAVHSAKDLQSTLPDGFEVLAVCERAQAQDVIISDQELDLQSSETILGTSSTRRIALLKHYFPRIKTVDVRGNLQTRIDKLRTGSMHGLVLAYAGVNRMSYDSLIKHWLDLDKFVPPVGQGAIAVENHERLPDAAKTKIRSIANHLPTEQRVLAERAFLKGMDGGCSVPVFGHAELELDGQIRLTGGVVSLDGRKLVRRTMYGSSATELGSALAKEVLKSGGAEILVALRT
ncbi:MAG: hydroxymethylbilane synthase [Bacteroidota bacterium]